MSLAIVGSVAIGILLGSTVFSSVMARSATGKENVGLLLTGTENVKVMAPDGNIVSQWTGPDPVTYLTQNALAACITGTDGGSTDPIGPPSVIGGSGSCSSFINAVAIVYAPEYGCVINMEAVTLNGFTVTGCQAATSATNYLTPLGCSPNSSTAANPPPLCSGWITQATFGPGTFTSTNCIYNQAETPCSVVQVDAGNLQQMLIFDGSFDYVNPTPIPVAAGDSMLVTITFTIS